jgi:hypothetical protein
VLAAALNSGKKKPRPVSEIYIHKLGQMLDFFTIMNALKNMKASPNNDFSFFKRYVGPTFVCEREAERLVMPDDH